MNQAVKKCSILLIDDHPLFRSALKQAAAQAIGHDPIKEASTLDSLFEMLLAHPETELVFLDFDLV